MYWSGPGHIIKQNRTITLFLEAALKYKPAIEVFLEAFQELLKNPPLERLIQSLTFVADRVKDSQPFEDFFCNNILPCCLKPKFRSNPKLMRKLATVMIKYCREDDHEHFQRRIVQLMLFFFIEGSDKCFDGALKIGDCLSQDDRLKVGPFIQHFFDNYVRENSPEGNVHWMKICRIFKYLTVDVEGNLTETLDDLLTHYRPNKIAQIGALLGILGPRKYEPHISDSLSPTLPQPPLNISPALYAKSPKFWNIIAKHQTRLTDMTRTHPEGGSTCIKRTLRMKSWLADSFTDAKSKEVSAIPIALIILTA